MSLVLWLCHAANHEHIGSFVRYRVTDLKLFLLLRHICDTNLCTFCPTFAHCGAYQSLWCAC